jgi:hypothetical protein
MKTKKKKRPNYMYTIDRSIRKGKNDPYLRQYVCECKRPTQNGT